jgi:hypothetical protein
LSKIRVKGSVSNELRATESIFTRNGATQFLSPISLENRLGFPCYYQTRLPKTIFRFIRDRFGLRCRFSSQWGRSNQRGDLQQTGSSNSPLPAIGISVAIAVRVAVFNFSGQSTSSRSKRNLEAKSKKESKHVIRSYGYRRIELLGPHPGCA